MTNGEGTGDSQRLPLDGRRNHTRRMRGGFVYVMTNRPNGTLYVGVTNDMARRACEHCIGALEGFTKHYGLTHLVHVEPFESISAAIRRERNIKYWP